MKKIATKLRGTIPIVSFMFLLLFFVTSKTFSQVTIVTANAATGTSSTVNSLTSVPAGALLVLVTSSETELTTNCSISSNPSLSWTRRANAEADNSGDVVVVAMEDSGTRILPGTANRRNR